MSETKLAKLEEQLASKSKEIDEMKGVISKISRNYNDLSSTVGTLNKDVANVRDAIQSLTNWARDQDDENTGRYASTSRF